MMPFEKPDTVMIVRQRLLENANDVDALFVLAALHARDGQLDQGLTILEQVLVLNPMYPGAWRFKATLHRIHGQPDAERFARERAEAVEP